MKLLNLGEYKTPTSPATQTSSAMSFEQGRETWAPTGVGPTGSNVRDHRIPGNYATAAQFASTQQFAVTGQMQPLDQPTAPSGPPAPPAVGPDPGITCPSGTIYDAATLRCLPTQAPSPYPTPNQDVVPIVAPAVPVGYIAIGNRAYPRWWIWAGVGALGFGALLLAILASRRRRSAA